MSSVSLFFDSLNKSGETGYSYTLSYIKVLPRLHKYRAGFYKLPGNSDLPYYSIIFSGNLNLSRIPSIFSSRRITCPLGQIDDRFGNCIEEGLKQYDNSYSNETYEALAWVGLRGEGGINGVTGLTENPTAAWENLDQERRLELIDLNDMFKENNPNCQ